MEESSRRLTCVAVGAAFALCAACAQKPPQPATLPLVPTASNAAAAPVERASAAPPVAAAPTPLDACDRVRQHNLAELRDASAHGAAIVNKVGSGVFLRHLDAAKQRAATAGAVTVSAQNGPVRVDSLDDRSLATLQRVSPDVLEYTRARDQVTVLTGVQQALAAHQPLPATAAAFDVELCKPDAQGAWAFWTTAAAYQPMDDTWGEWELSRNVALARISTDGTVTLAKSFPSFLHASSPDADFPRLVADNCCAEGYGVGEPRLLFLNDQNGDGVPEIGLRADYGVEGSHDVSSVLYRFDHGKIVEESPPAQSMTDVDGDGRLDILAVQQVPGADQCGSGFPSYSESPPYLGHALPDGTYSFDDAAARAYLLKKCPARPKSLTTTNEIWCAKAWGASAAALLASAHRHCVKDPCRAQSSLPVCENFDFALKGFEPPLTLSAAAP